MDWHRPRSSARLPARTARSAGNDFFAGLEAKPVLLPVTGHPLHTRSLTLVVSQQADGRWHARGDVIDLRKVGFVPIPTDLQPAGIIHQMRIDLEIDPSSGTIETISTDQPVVAIEPSEQSRGECCRDPAPRLLELQGSTLDDAFPKQLSQVFGGPRGCSHLLTLFQMMAAGIRRLRSLELAGTPEAERSADERLFWRSVFVDGYEADDGTIELCLQQGDFWSRPARVAQTPLSRLAGEWAIRAFARVGSRDLKLSDVRLVERFRSFSRSEGDLSSSDWHDHSARLASLEGTPIIPGLARRLFELLGDRAEDELRLDAMLQLAPGHIQVMAAVMDRWLSQGGRASSSAGGEGADFASLPEVGRIGGMPDSCYIWRADGPLARMQTPGGNSTGSEDSGASEAGDD